MPDRAQLTRERACEPCTAYRRGERENAVYLGIPVHACEKKRDLEVMAWLDCPCGCVAREPGQIDTDKALYGGAFIGPLGERIDPTTVRSA